MIGPRVSFLVLRAVPGVSCSERGTDRGTRNEAPTEARNTRNEVREV
jgi:hypothetical protein